MSAVAQAPARDPMTPRLKAALTGASARVDGVLDSLLARHPDQPEKIREAMRYSIFAGGKRLRPMLVAEAARACGRQGKDILLCAAALEMIHTYSLIHDDLPAMDDDDLRRGRPTCHKVFGDAMAILAGDGLLTLAFEAAASAAAEAGLDGPQTAALIRAVARGAGTQGMVGGQVADLQSEGRLRQGAPRARGLASTLSFIHLHKTAALIVASVEAGAILAGAPARERAALARYGRALGLAFQIADDILDVVGDKKKLGKKGSDRDNGKLTYASLFGLEGARRRAALMSREARRALAPFGERASVLSDLADYVIARDR